VVLAAVTQDDWALQYASFAFQNARFRNDLQLNYPVIKQRPSLLKAFDKTTRKKIIYFRILMSKTKTINKSKKELLDEDTVALILSYI